MAEATSRQTFVCEACGGRHTWKAPFAGKMAKCTTGKLVRVPDAPTPAEEPRDDGDFAGAFDSMSWSDDDAGASAPAAAAPPPIVRKPAPARGKPAKAKAKATAKSPGRSDRSAKPTHGVGRILVRFVLGPILIFAALLFGVKVFQARQKFNEGIVNAVPFTATVIGRPSIWNLSPDPDKWSYTIPVEYVIEGRRHVGGLKLEGPSFLPAGARPRDADSFIGKSIPMVYDSTNPERVAPAGAISRATRNFYIGVAICVVAIAAGVFCLTRRPT